MKKVTFKVVGQWPNNKVYQATDGKKTIPFNIETVHDGIGSLKRVECSAIGYFEEYKMQDIKNRIVSTIQLIYYAIRDRRILPY